ncbi:MAG TPA: DNA repair protein RecO [Nitrospiria bacterium]|nr:DNA repair protein RecO [Nitrospiria bacterium]
MSLLTSPAVVTGSMRLGEADKLITFFTLKKGKIKGAAPGARRMKNRFGSALEPFTHVSVVLFDRGGDRLARINQVDIVHSFHSLREDLEKIKHGVNMINLVNRLTPEAEANGKIFRLLIEGLSLLENGLDPPLSEILFISRLVAYSGYQPHWDKCLKCHREIPDRAIRFSAAMGGAVCHACSQETSYSLCTVSRGTLAFVRSAQRMDFVAAHRLRATPPMAAEVRALLQAQLTHILGYPPVLVS